MDNRKVKNLIIILLLLVDVFLLVLVISGSFQKAEAEKQKSSALLSVLEKQGIELANGVSLSEKCPDVIELERSVRKEKKMLSALIGSCSVEDQGGDVYIFKGENGEASLRSTGYFELALDSVVVPVDGDPLAAAKTTLKKLGISYDKELLQVDSDGDLTCVTATCLYDGRRVLNATVNMYFSDNRLVFITGRRPLDVEDTTSTANDNLDAVTILMAFLESSRKSGNVCSSILDVSTCYLLDSATVGGCTLTPVWCIETDAGSFYFNGITGKPRTVEK